MYKITTTKGVEFTFSDLKEAASWLVNTMEDRYHKSWDFRIIGARDYLKEWFDISHENEIASFLASDEESDEDKKALRSYTEQVELCGGWNATLLIIGWDNETIYEYSEAEFFHQVEDECKKYRFTIEELS